MDTEEADQAAIEAACEGLRIAIKAVRAEHQRWCSGPQWAVLWLAWADRWISGEDRTLESVERAALEAEVAYEADLRAVHGVSFQSGWPTPARLAVIATRAARAALRQFDLGRIIWDVEGHHKPVHELRLEVVLRRLEEVRDIGARLDAPEVPRHQRVSPVS